MEPVRVLFVCVENSKRSQMAEAFARMHGAGVLEPASAGSRPCGHISKHAIRVMGERGYDLSTHTSNSISDFEGERWDWVITMGCGDACPSVQATHHEDWNLPDPHGMGPAGFEQVADEIEKRVKELVDRVREQGA